MTDRIKYALSGAAAGAVNGLFGGGGGMVLAPALTGWCHMEQKRALATCVAAILPLCLLSAAISLWRQPLDWMQALPYLLGGLGGGFVGGRLFQKVSNLWLRRIFACFLLYGGVEVSPVTAWLLPLAVGFATGILSAWGVGGGTLLLLCMTLLLGVDQRTAQTINLLYFLPTAGMGLLSHGKSGLLEKPVLRSAVPAGLTAAALAAWLSFSVDTELLRRPFGVYLLAAGIYILLQKPTKP